MVLCSILTSNKLLYFFLHKSIVASIITIASHQLDLSQLKDPSLFLLFLSVTVHLSRALTHSNSLSHFDFVTFSVSVFLSVQWIPFSTHCLTPNGCNLHWLYDVFPTLQLKLILIPKVISCWSLSPYWWNTRTLYHLLFATCLVALNFLWDCKSMYFFFFVFKSWSVEWLAFICVHMY